MAHQHVCSYKPSLPELSVSGDGPVSGLVEEEQVGGDCWLLAVILNEDNYSMSIY